jgi:Ca-activated chloride channel homolog
MKIKFVAVFVLLLFIAMPTFSQKKNEASAPLEVRVNLFALNSVNQSAEDVKAEDLKIFEDGVEQKITYFAKKEPVLNVVILADNTGSMRTQLNKVILIGKTVIDNLRPKDEALVVRFVSGDKIEKLQEWTSNRNSLILAMENMYPEGGQSAITDALYLAAEESVKREKANGQNRYAVILISDGEDRENYYKPRDILAQLKGTDVQLFPFALMGELPAEKRLKAKNYLNELTQETGGRAFLFEKNVSGQILVEALKALMIELRSQYVIGYTSTNLKRDGKTRKLTVDLANDAKGGKRLGLVRDDFTVSEVKK